MPQTVMQMSTESSAKAGSSGKSARGGFFFALKGKQGEEELRESRRAVTLLGGRVAGVFEPRVDPATFTEQDFSEDERARWEAFCSTDRPIIVIEKCKPTPDAYPRAWAKMTKKPL